jgi:hypothetical protein
MAGAAEPLLERLTRRLACAQLAACYCAVLVSRAALGGSDDRPKELDELLEEQHAVVAVLRATVAELGGEPDGAGVPGNPDQVIEVTRTLALIADPGQALATSIGVLLAAFHADGPGWQGLPEVVAALGRPEIAARCEEARARREYLLDRLQAWVAERAAPARDLVQQPGGHGGGTGA